MEPRQEFFIITGLSGAGKSCVIDCFEDAGYFCVDNLIPALIPKFAQLCMHSKVLKVATVVDARGTHIEKDSFFQEFKKALTEIKSFNYTTKIIFLECDDDILIQRFSETRRKHPISKNHRVSEGIRMERKRLEPIKDIADYVIDTSKFNPTYLRKRMFNMFFPKPKDKPFTITILSFGFKYGLPLDADLIYDVRFIPNPFYNTDLAHLTGIDDNIKDFIFKFDESREFLKKLIDLHDFLIPLYYKEGKSHLTIGIGCTGGRHRSVTFAYELAKHLKKNKFKVNLEHRDIKK